MTEEKIDFKTLDADVLERELDEIDLRLTNVKQQLLKAEAEYKELGIPADAGWYSRAKSAERILAKKKQKLFVLISKVKKAQRLAEHEIREISEYQIFKKVLRRRVSDELYNEILEEVISIRDSERLKNDN